MWKVLVMLALHLTYYILLYAFTPEQVGVLLKLNALSFFSNLITILALSHALFYILLLDNLLTLLKEQIEVATNDFHSLNIDYVNHLLENFKEIHSRICGVLRTFNDTFGWSLFFICFSQFMQLTIGSSWLILHFQPQWYSVGLIREC